MLRTTTPRAREIPDTPTGKVGYARDPDKGLEYLRRLEEAPLAMSAARPAWAMRGDSAYLIRASRISSGVDSAEGRDLWAIWLRPRQSFSIRRMKCAVLRPSRALSFPIQIFFVLSLILVTASATASGGGSAVTSAYAAAPPERGLGRTGSGAVGAGWGDSEGGAEVGAFRAASLSLTG